jgi:phosphate uptake regulator
MKETKKVQQMGNALTMYLPHKWTETNGIEKGASVFVSETQDGSLMISAKKHDEKAVLSINCSDRQESLHRAVSSYISGADEIRLAGRNAFWVATEARKTLSAIEVHNEPDGIFVLRIIRETEQTPPEETIRRMFNSSRSLHEFVRGVVAGKVQASEAEIKERDDNIDRLYLLLIRQAYQSRSSFESGSNVIVAKSIERVADHVVAVGIEALRNPGLGSELDAYIDAFALYELAMQRYWKPEFSFEIFDQRDQLRKRILKRRPKETVYIAHCLRIADYACDIVEITCDRIQKSLLSVA